MAKIVILGGTGNTGRLIARRLLQFSDIGVVIATRSIGDQAQAYRNGYWTRLGSFDLRRIDFGDDIGVKNCVSMFFEELKPLPEMIPSLRKGGFYISESHWMTDWVVIPVLWER